MDISHLSFSLNLPLTPSEAKARHLSEETARLIVGARRSDEDVVETLTPIVQTLLNGADTIGVVAINVFKPNHSALMQLKDKCIGMMWGMRLYQVPDVSFVPIALHIPAESITLFACTPQSLPLLEARVNVQDQPWWRFTNQTLSGALASVPDLVDPTINYSASHRSIEILGSCQAVQRCYALLATWAARAGQLTGS